MIRFFDVSKHFAGGQSALRHVDFEIERGEFVFLTGASGAGKSTLLRLIYREELPSSGQIIVAGRSVASLPASKVPYLRRSIGVVFQSFRLIPRKTVFENVVLLPRLLGLSATEQKQRAREVLDRVGLADRMSAFPRELSGGEQQRVALARALVGAPEILLADEPTGNLDPDLSLEILQLLRETNRQGTTVVLATHDHRLIATVGRVLVLHQGELVSDTKSWSEANAQPSPPFPGVALEP